MATCSTWSSSPGRPARPGTRRRPRPPRPGRAGLAVVGELQGGGRGPACRAGRPALVEDQRPHRGRAQVERQHPRVRHAASRLCPRAPGGAVPARAPRPVPLIPRPSRLYRAVVPSRSCPRGMYVPFGRQPWNSGDGTDVAGSAPPSGQERAAPRAGAGGGRPVAPRPGRARPLGRPGPPVAARPARPPAPTPAAAAADAERQLEERSWRLAVTTHPPGPSSRSGPQPRGRPAGPDPLQGRPARR